MNQGAWYCSQHHLRRIWAASTSRSYRARGPRRFCRPSMWLCFDARRAAGKTAARRVYRLTPSRT
jgi:hypothetical protein